MSDLIYAQWAHAQAHENLKHRIATGDVLLAQANALLTVLVVGLGGAVGYVANLLKSPHPTPELAGALVVMLWMMWLAVVLMFRCIATRNTDVVGNEPGNIYCPDEDDAHLRAVQFELGSVQRRIDSTKKRNRAVAWWLDKCRYATLCTPVIYLLVVWGAGGYLG